MSILAKNLRTIRKELQCTQSMMSDILKVGFRTYVRYEAGERDAVVSVLVKVARLGNISLEQMLTKEVGKSFIAPVKTLAKNSAPPQIRMVNFSSGQINLKNPAKQELLAINLAEKKLLSLFRKMDPDLQKNSLDNIGKALQKKKRGGDSRTAAGKKKKTAGRAKSKSVVKKARKAVKSKASGQVKKRSR